MMSGKTFLLLFSFGVVQFTSTAQPARRQVTTQAQSWFSINNTIRLTNKFGVIADVHMRRSDFLEKESFYFVRLAGNFWLKENITIAAGYAHMWLAPARTDWTHYAQEHRTYQQIQLSSRLGKINVLQRLRNEQRWQEKITDDQFTQQYKFTDRIRYLLSFTVPVFKNPDLPKLVVSDELAIQFGKEVVYNTFDQNRAFAGIRQAICKTLAFDFGYMIVYQQKASGYQYDKNNTLRCFLYYTPDARHKAQQEL